MGFILADIPRMKLRFAILLPSITASVLLSSCATKFTAAQRAQLSTVAITKTTVDPEAYEEPYGGDIDARNRASNVPGFGALGPLVGAAVGHSIAGTQNNMFRGENSGHFTLVQKNTPRDLPVRLQTKLQDSLKNDSFFKSRLRPSSSNVITSEITSYRLLRVGKDDNDKLLFTPEVYVNIYLKDSAGTNLAGRTYIGRGTQSYTIDQYAASSEKTRKAYEDALDNAVAAFKAELAIKTGE